ncbi:hypothetical protein, variant 4 [Aphanomyces astaci]|uniref:Tesmin/TSO1-like CXC domain-containing protein n=1 Tax=Aphanomyces astaci TaxID=112090 RepID=W4FCZ5_APHAT|nr:hypothetical protein, variant 4 [Aphanomyces astaci]ETV65355.1 hypothetical protein, variant 4 [Aphanomyces astaci]|eukprot:XP_009845148.1 hypothetical protein, variant 4 [Aphanomyces astaci]
MQSPGTIPSVEALMAEDDQAQHTEGTVTENEHGDNGDGTWVSPVNELDSEFSSLILDPTASSSSTESPSSIGISPMTLHWLQHTLNATSGSGTFSALTEFDIALLSPYVPPPMSSNAGMVKDEFRGEAIDWKSFNENNYDDHQADTSPDQWKDIPQFRPPVAAPGPPPPTEQPSPQSEGPVQKLLTSTVYNMWPQNSVPSSASQPQPPMIPPASAYDSNKRKAIISPEFVQYESTPVPHVQPTRRPSKKVPSSVVVVADTKPASGLLAPITESPDSKGTIRCKCTGKCRNARCACVKAGQLCGIECKCSHCANPFVPMHAWGIDISKIMTDKCLMQNFSRIKDMDEVLVSLVDLECPCGAPTVQVPVYTTLLHPTKTNNIHHDDSVYLFPISCLKCPNIFHYSWCTGKLWWNKQPRKHCEICKRCGSHRNQHCPDCGHCYFAGVANSFACPCKQTPASGGPGRRAVRLTQAIAARAAATPVSSRHQSIVPRRKRQR